MRAAGTDAIGVLRWGLRRYRALVVVCLLLGVVLAPLAVVQRGTVVEAEALVIAQRLDMSLTALPRYGQAVFNNGDVARAVATKFGDLGGFEDVVPDRVYVVAEQDSIVFRVIGMDVDPEAAAAIANTAADTFVQALNTAGAGVGTFALQSRAQPPTSEGGNSGLLLAVPVGLVAGLLLGLAVVSVLLVIRRPVIDGPDAEETTGVPVLGTVTIPRTRGGVTARPQEFAGLIPVCRRLLALPTPTLIMVSRRREERVRKQLSLALTSVLGGVRDIRFIGSSELQDVVAGQRAAAASTQVQPPAAVAPEADSLTLVDSSEPLDLVQPPHSTATVLVVPEGIGSTALRAAVVEHLGGSAEARLLLVRRGRRSRRTSEADERETREPKHHEPAAMADNR
jgi:capsular polysaccharide biosynthesis protein